MFKLMKAKNLRIAAPVFVILSALIALSRHLADIYTGDGVIIRGLVSLRVVNNAGAAFGLLSGVPVLAAALGIAALMALTGYILFGRMNASMRAGSMERVGLVGNWDCITFDEVAGDERTFVMV